MSSYGNHLLQWAKPRLEGQVALEGPQPTALGHAGCTGAHFKSCIDGLGAHGVIGTNREILVKYLRGIKVHSSKKVTAEVPPQLRMQHHQQTGVGSHCAARKL